MSAVLPNLHALTLFVAVVDEGSLGAGARKLGMYQPNASRMIAQLEAEAKMSLLRRHPRGSRPTSAGLLFAKHARELLDAAQRFSDMVDHHTAHGAIEFRVGASMTIAETLLPTWLTDLRRVAPRVRVDLHVLNSAQVIEEVRDLRLQLGFVETPQLPGNLHSTTIWEDELAVLVCPRHPWAARPGGITLAELAATPLVVREGGSGTRDAFEELADGFPLAEPAQVLSSNAAVRVAVTAGAGPTVLSTLTVHTQLVSGELVRVPLRNARLCRPFTAIWKGAQEPHGIAAQLLRAAQVPSGRAPVR